MDSVLWWTGDAVWVSVAIFVVWILILVCRDLLKASIYFAKFTRNVRVWKNAKGPRDWLQLWWFCFKTGEYTMNKMLKL